jgi:hypothetical protein
LKPRPNEKDYHDSLTHTALPLHLRVGDEEIIDDEPAEGGEDDIVTQSPMFEERAMEHNLSHTETEQEESLSG